MNTAAFPLKEAEGGWTDAQVELAGLSTNSVHPVLPDASHSMLTENETAAAQSSQAVVDVVNAVRAGKTLTEAGH